MPTNMPASSQSAAQVIPASARIESSRSDDVTVLLLWTATGLAITLGLAAFGLAPSIAESLLLLA